MKAMSVKEFVLYMFVLLVGYGLIQLNRWHWKNVVVLGTWWERLRFWLVVVIAYGGTILALKLCEGL